MAWWWAAAAVAAYRQGGMVVGVTGQAPTWRWSRQGPHLVRCWGWAPAGAGPPLVVLATWALTIVAASAAGVLLGPWRDPAAATALAVPPAELPTTGIGQAAVRVAVTQRSGCCC